MEDGDEEEEAGGYPEHLGHPLGVAEERVIHDECDVVEILEITKVVELSSQRNGRQKTLLKLLSDRDQEQRSTRLKRRERQTGDLREERRIVQLCTAGTETVIIPMVR